jgi:hypothetical protein
MTDIDTAAAVQQLIQTKGMTAVLQAVISTMPSDDGDGYLQALWLSLSDALDEYKNRYGDRQ